MGGTEPHREVPPLDPKPGASANSATSAYVSPAEPLLEQVMGVEPTSSAWKADALAVELFPPDAVVP